MLLCLLACYAWGQKKFPVQKIVRAATPTASARPYAQLLADTHSFIRLNGRRPRACITDVRGLKIPVTRLKGAQLTEFQLAGVISRTLSAFRSGELNSSDPDLKELQTLVAQHPNPRNNRRVTPYILKHRELQRQRNILDICARATQYIEEHGVRPRSGIYEEGFYLTMEEIKQNYPQCYEEIHLGRQIHNLLYWADTYAPDHPQINRLRNLLKQYSRKNKEP